MRPHASILICLAILVLVASACAANSEGASSLDSDEAPSDGVSEQREIVATGVGEGELEAAAFKALECVQAQGFSDVEVILDRRDDGSLAVVWGFFEESLVEEAIQECELEHLRIVQQAYEAPFVETDQASYRQVATCLEQSGMDLPEWDDDNLSSVLGEAVEVNYDLYINCFSEAFNLPSVNGDAGSEG